MKHVALAIIVARALPIAADAQGIERNIAVFGASGLRTTPEIITIKDVA